MLARAVAIGLTTLLALFSAACGGGAPRAATADLVAIRQPTPDPTLDAVVRDLPRALAGVLAPTPRPTATLPPAVVVSAPTPRPKPAPPAPASTLVPATLAPTLVPTARPTVRIAQPLPSPAKPHP